MATSLPKVESGKSARILRTTSNDEGEASSRKTKTRKGMRNSDLSRYDISVDSPAESVKATIRAASNSSRLTDSWNEMSSTTIPYSSPADPTLRSAFSARIICGEPETNALTCTDPSIWDRTTDPSFPNTTINRSKRSTNTSSSP